jgi:hypothetical protein
MVSGTWGLGSTTECSSRMMDAYMLGGVVTTKSLVWAVKDERKRLL